MVLFIAVWAGIGFSVIATGVADNKMEKKARLRGVPLNLDDSVQDVDLSCPGIGNRFRYCDIQRIEINLPHRATGLLLAYALAGDYTYQSSYRHGLHLGSLLALTCIKGLSRGSSSTLALRTLLSTSTGRALLPLQG